jgi:hypothetical protein
MTTKREQRLALSLAALGVLLIVWHYSEGSAILALSGLVIWEGLVGIYNRRVDVKSRITSLTTTYTGWSAIFWSALYLLVGCFIAATGLYKLRPSLF